MKQGNLLILKNPNDESLRKITVIFKEIILNKQKEFFMKKSDA